MDGYKIADGRNPYMGLNNTVCKNPVFWCKIHNVWLSEEDIKLKKCMCKPTFDMMGSIRCGGLAKREIK